MSTTVAKTTLTARASPAPASRSKTTSLPAQRPAGGSLPVTSARHADPTAIASRLKDRLAQLGAQSGLALYDELLPQLDRLCVGYVARALRQMGCPLNSRQRLSVAALAHQSGVIAPFRPLFARLLDMLREDGFVEGDAELAFRPLPAFDDLPEHQQMLLSGYPACSAELTLLNQCGLHLSEILQGPGQLIPRRVCGSG